MSQPLSHVLSVLVLARRDLTIHRSHLHGTVVRKREDIEDIIARHGKGGPPDQHNSE